MALLNIDKSSLPEADSFELIPEGWYNAKAKTVELKPTNDKTGQYLAICWKLDNNRTVYGNINLKNRSDVAEKIGLQQLNQLMGAIGITKIKDTDELIGRPVQIKVGIGKKQEGYDQRNEVKAFKAVEGSAIPKVEEKKTPFETAQTAPWGAM